MDARHVEIAAVSQDGAFERRVRRTEIAVVSQGGDLVPLNDCWVWDGSQEVPASVFVWDGSREVPADLEVV